MPLWVGSNLIFEMPPRKKSAPFGERRVDLVGVLAQRELPGRAAVAGLVQADLRRTWRREASAVDRRRAVPGDRGADQDVLGVGRVHRHRGDRAVEREVLAVGEGLHLPEAPGPVGGLVEAERPPRSPRIRSAHRCRRRTRRRSAPGRGCRSLSTGCRSRCGSRSGVPPARCWSSRGRRRRCRRRGRSRSSGRCVRAPARWCDRRRTPGCPCRWPPRPGCRRWGRPRSRSGRPRRPRPWRCTERPSAVADRVRALPKARAAPFCCAEEIVLRGRARWS